MEDRNENRYPKSQRQNHYNGRGRGGRRNQNSGHNSRRNQYNDHDDRFFVDDKENAHGNRHAEDLEELHHHYPPQHNPTQHHSKQRYRNNYDDRSRHRPNEHRGDAEYNDGRQTSNSAQRFSKTYNPKSNQKHNPSSQNDQEKDELNSLSVTLDNLLLGDGDKSRKVVESKRDFEKGEQYSNDSRRNERNDRSYYKQERGGKRGNFNQENPRRNNERRKRPPKNTETFEPSHAQPDMRVIVASGRDQCYPRRYCCNDIIYVPDLYCDPEDLSIYDKLLREIQHSGVDEDQLWKLWHGDSHLIADDRKNWKRSCPTFNSIIEQAEDYFKIDVKATRFNWYRDGKEWKPFHFDAAAVKPDKAKTQNISIAISFGAEREAAFEHATTRSIVSMPLPNGSIYVFSKLVNVEWRHGILQLPPDKQDIPGRISIILWGFVDDMESFTR